MFALLILLGQKQDPCRNEPYNLIKMCKCVGIFFGERWMHSFALSLSLLYFLWMWTIFLFSFLFYSSFFLTCLAGMWHTFFGYASLLLYFCSFFYMPFEHMAYPLWVCIFYFFFFFFFIAHILDGQERKSHGMSWSFIMWVEIMFAIFYCRRIACEWTCT